MKLVSSCSNAVMAITASALPHYRNANVAVIECGAMAGEASAVWFAAGQKSPLPHEVR
jgi:hypothetical protein